MSIITISRGSYSKGKEIAEKVAHELGYRCLAREVLLEASREFNVPEVKLVRALHDAPSVFDRLGYSKDRYIAYLQSALLNSLKSDNVVYHGLAGHFFLKDVSHVLKVRIIADLEDRVRLEMAREGISREKALQLLVQDDQERRKWAQHLFGIDTADSSLYDLVIHIRKISVEDAVRIIVQTVKLPTFKTTAESQQALEDLALAAEVRAALVDIKPDIQVVSTKGMVLIGAKYSPILVPEMVERMERTAREIPGVEEVEIKVAHLVDWS